MVYYKVWSRNFFYCRSSIKRIQATVKAYLGGYLLLVMGYFGLKEAYTRGNLYEAGNGDLKKSFGLHGKNVGQPWVTSGNTLI